MQIILPEGFFLIKGGKMATAVVKKIMDAGLQGGRFIFGTLVMPLLIPEKNIQTMFDAAKIYGEYNATQRN